MTASFTIRATELFCWSANFVSRLWSSGSKREWIESGGGLFGGRRIMLHFDSFWWILRVYVLPAWKGKRLPEIDKGTVRSLIADIAGRAPIMANRVLTQVKTLFNWAVAEDILTAPPCAGLKPPAAKTSRDRVFGRSRTRRRLAGLP